MTQNASNHGSFSQRYLTPTSPGNHQPPYSNWRQDPSFRNSSQQEIEDSMPYSRTPECQKVLDRISTFCGQDNLVQRVAFLDQELSVYGYPTVLSDIHYTRQGNSPKQQHGSIDLVNLVNIAYDLLQSWRQSIESHSDATDLQRSTESEVVRLQHLISRLKEDAANKDREMKSKEMMHLQMNQRMESLKKKFKVEQEKCKRLGTEIAMRDSQFRHEKKKKVQEVEKLQARLQQLLQDKRQERMLGIEILNSLQRSDGKRGRWSTDKSKKSNEQDMYRLIITNYEDAQKQLLKENAGMRKYLKEMQAELIAALNERGNSSTAHDLSNSSMQNKVEGQGEGEKMSSRSSSAASNVSEASDASEPMSDGMFEMPYDLVKEDIERSIRAKWRALKKEIRKTRVKESSAKKSEKENFNQNEYDDLVHQQQELIDYLTTAQAGTSERPVPEDCYFLEEKADLEKQKNLFMQQKAAFEKERKLYAEALLQLDEQRQNFESEKNKWLQQNFLQLTPFRDARTSAGSTSSPHRTYRGSELSKNRPQPYKPRPSSSPDRSALKRSDQANSYQNHGNVDQNSPISHTLSRLHSSSHHNSFSPENNTHRSPEVSWQNHTPDAQKPHVHPHKSKSTPNTGGAVLPPTTAELYRSLGLVYYGNDKENVESGRLPRHHEKRITSTSKTEHQRNIRRFHHRMKASPPSGLKPSPPCYEKRDSIDCSSIRRSYDSSYDRTVVSTVDSPNRSHKRSISAPKENFLDSGGKHARNPYENNPNGNTDNSGYDTVVEASVIEKSNDRFVVVEDLKAALFQD